MLDRAKAGTGAAGWEVHLSTGFLDEGVLVSAGQPLFLPQLLSLVLPRWVKQQCEFAKQAQNPEEGPKLDLGFKEGQTIKINIAVSPTFTWLCGSPPSPKPPIPTAFPAQSIHVGRIDPAASPRGRFTLGHQASASMAFQVEQSLYKWDCKKAGETTTRACPRAGTAGGKGMAHSAGTQGRLSGSSDLRVGRHEGAEGIQYQHWCFQPACWSGSRESSALSQAVLASYLHKEGWEHSGLEGNKEDARSLGQLLLVVLSWLLESSSCVAMHTASPASSC